MARVLIVGAGPAGAGLALALARRGDLAVELVEASGNALGRFRGEGLMPSGLDALERLGIWPLPDGVPQRALSGWSFHVERQHLFTAAEPFAGGDSCRLIDQPALLGHLLQEAERNGCRLHWGRAVAGLRHEQGRVSGVTLADGRELAADLVVACDGRDSLLRRLAGLELAEKPDPLGVVWFALQGPGADAIATALAGRFLTCVGGGDSWALFASVRGGLQLGWAEPALGPEPPRPSSPQAWRERWAAAAPAPLAELLLAMADAELDGPRPMAVRVGLARHWQVPGLLLLGDAAHPMSPLRAQGLNMALRDAVVAAERLGPALATGQPQAIDAAAAAVSAARRPELVAVQRAQRQEADRALLLRGSPLLRGLLRRLAPWLGTTLRRRWVREQDRLRHGLPLP